MMTKLTIGECLKHKIDFVSCLPRHKGVAPPELSGKKRDRPVGRWEGKSEDIQIARRCFTDTFIVHFPARHFTDDKRMARSFGKAFHCLLKMWVLEDTLD